MSFGSSNSAWYDGGKIKLSRDRVDRLGYFQSVEIETEEVPGTTDQVDLTIKVAEKPTGNLLIGAGYSSMDKVTLNASIKQENVFGTGNKSNLDEVELTERCWKGYTQKGMKTMFGKKYPNCVKVKKK